jgi:methyl-accepting chemotaxis protein
LLPYALKFVQWASDLIAKFQALTPVQQKWIIVIGAVVAAIGPLLMIVGSIATALGAIIPVITAVAAALSFPLIAIILAVVAVVALLYAAWTNNWGGIQEKMAALWAVLQPIFVQLWTWLSVQLTAALAWLAVMWQSVLLPAILAVWSFISTILWPMLVNLAAFLVAVFGTALIGLSAIWQNVLLPAITAVWGFISNSLWPLFVSIANFLGAVLGLALRGLAGIWQDVLAPALKVAWDWLTKVYNIIKGPVMEVVQRLARVLVGDLATGIQEASDTLSGLQKIFNRIAGAIASAIKKIREFIDALTEAMGMDLGNFEPGSPTPFEMGLTGIGQAMSRLVNIQLPNLSAGLDLPSAMPGGDFAMQTMGDLTTGIPEASDTISGLQKIFNSIADAIAGAINKIREMVDTLQNMTLPDWLTPGSPTPFELGLLGIGQAMSQLSNMRLPNLSTSLDLLPGAMPFGDLAMQTVGGGSVPSSQINVEVNAQVANDIDIETLAYRIADVIARRTK